MSNSDSGVESCSEQSNEDMSVESASESSESRSPTPAPSPPPRPSHDFQQNSVRNLANSGVDKEVIDRSNLRLMWNLSLRQNASHQSELEHLMPMNFTSDSVEKQLIHSPYEQADITRKSVSKFSPSIFRTDRMKIKDRMDARRLLQAVYVNDVGKVVELMRNNVDPDGTNLKKTTALHIAAAQGYAECVQVLIQHGADPNLKDVIGNTPLHLAAVRSHVGIVTLLLKAGTDLKLIDISGRTPLQIAQARLKRLKDDKRSSLLLKGEIIQIVEMMQTYLQKTGQSVDAKLLTMFTNQLNFRQTREEIDDDVQHLLTSLNRLDISKKEKS